MMLNRDVKILIFLLILVGFLFSGMVIINLYYNPIQSNLDDSQDDVIPQHYNLEFMDHENQIISQAMIFFQLTQNRYQFSIVKSIDHLIEISSITLYQNRISIPIHIQINNDHVIIKKRRWRGIFHTGNYSISIRIHNNISNTSFTHQQWSSKYRILFTNNHFFPYLAHSFYQSTFNITLNTSDHIISNFPLNQTTSLLSISQLAFAFLHQYECRSIDILQLCLPMYFVDTMDFYSYILNYTLHTIRIYESYFSRNFPLKKLTIVAVLELHDRFISKPGLVFIDQNTLLTNTSAEQMIRQQELIYFLVAYQWFDTSIRSHRNYQWIEKSLAGSIARHLYYPNASFHSSLERFMSTVVIDSLCNTELTIKETNNNMLENRAIEKGEAFFTDYRLHISDGQFQSRIQLSNISSQNQTTLLSTLFQNSSLTWLQLPGHPVISFNSTSPININLFKLNSNCSTSIPPNYLSSSLVHLPTSSNFSITSIPLNPFIHVYHPAWNRLIEELKTVHQQINGFSKLLFDSFLFNFANQLSIEYPFQFLNLFFKQPLSFITKHDLLLIRKLVQWYRSILSNSLEEKFVSFLRKILNPFCLSHLWTRHGLTDSKYSNQQHINDIFLELCCSINHSICLQQISNRNDPQILIQFIFNQQPIDLITMKPTNNRNQTDMSTSFNQLQIPSLFRYPDRIIMQIVCQIVRQHNDKYWYDFIQFIQQKFQYQHIPFAIMTGIACAIRTVGQIDFYLTNLCPPSPFKWPCYRNILAYASIKNFEQLKTIDDEQWPSNNDELVDFLFHTGATQGNFSSHSIVREFQMVILTWLTNNEEEILHWFENANNQNA